MKKILITILLLFYLSANLFSHHIVMYGYVEKGQIVTESTFPNGNPVQQAEIKVLSSDGTLLLEGKSGEDGKFAFKVPPVVMESKSDLTIVLHAGQGHMEKLNLSYEDIAKNLNSPDLSAGGSGETLGTHHAPETYRGMGAKIVLGLAGIAMFFAILYYIKRKLKI